MILCDEGPVSVFDLLAAFRAATAQKRLGEMGFSQRRAAPLLGVTFEHLNRVLRGHRKSRRLLTKIEALKVELGV